MGDTNGSVGAEHEIIGATPLIDNKKEFVRNTHPGAQWFGGPGIGVFLHWGLASVFGNTDLSWGMFSGWEWEEHLPGYPLIRSVEYYEEGLKRFRPDKYDPLKWLSAAKEAGASYAVFTTKHHEGFTLWPSEFGEIGVKQYMPGRDFVAEYVEACRKCGLKVGLYYSPPDWYFNRRYMSFCSKTYGKEAKGGIHQTFEGEMVDTLPEMPAAHRQAYYDLIRGQTLELLTRYGEIDIIWFDGRGVRETDPDPVSVEEIRALQPQILINPRMHGVGDFSTPECSFPESAPEGWWEVCHQLNSHGWGYTAHFYKDFGWLTDSIEKVCGLGGKFLFNVGPMASGELPDEYYYRMRQLKSWLAVKENRDLIGIH